MLMQSLNNLKTYIKESGLSTDPMGNKFDCNGLHSEEKQSEEKHSEEKHTGKAKE